MEHIGRPFSKLYCARCVARELVGYRGSLRSALLMRTYSRYLITSRKQVHYTILQDDKCVSPVGSSIATVRADDRFP